MGIRIPDGMRFAELRLTRDPDGSVSMDLGVVRRIAEASGIDDPAALLGNEDALSALVVAWYHAARAAGEPPDPVQEDLIDEAAAEDRHGSGFSHPPGRA